MRWRGVLLGLLMVSCESSPAGLLADGEPPLDAGQPDAEAPDLLAPPTVTDVVDEGGDGSAVVGERVWLKGRRFGANCAVRFGAVPARLLSVSAVDLRLQVPEGIPVGLHNATLDCDNGEAQFNLAVRRYHLVSLPAGDRVAVLEETAPNQITDTSRRLTLNDAEWLALSDDSAVAYVASATSSTSSPEIKMVDLTAGGGPALLPGSVAYSESIKMPIFGLAAAAEAPLLAVAGGLYVVLYDISDPRSPARVGAIQLISTTPGQTLPEIKAGFLTRVALTPDGTRAVVLDGAADELSVYDIASPAAPKLLKGGIVVSGGTPTKPMVQLPIPFLSGVLGLIKVQGGSAQALALSSDGKVAAVLAGGGVGALVPETFNLDLHNSTVSVVDVQSGTHLVKLVQLPEAHVPNGIAFAPDGSIYVSSLSSASAVLIKILFQLGVAALAGGGLDLTTVGSILVGNFKDFIGVVKAVWDGTLFDLGGLHHVVPTSPGNAAVSNRQLPYLQGGLCATYDGQRLVASSQGWNVDIRFGALDMVQSFVFKYELAATVHDAAQKAHSDLALLPWQAKLLLPPWSFGQAACQQ